MKRQLQRGAILAVLIIAGASLGAVAGAEDAWRERIVTSTYQAPGGVAGVAAGTTVVGGERYGGAVLTAADGEVLVSVSITDESGLPVLAEVSQARDGTPDPASAARVCGGTDEPLAIEPGAEVTVSVVVGPCGGSISVPTRGEVEATFFAPVEPAG